MGKRCSQQLPSSLIWNVPRIPAEHSKHTLRLRDETIIGHYFSVSSDIFLGATIKHTFSNLILGAIM